MLMWDMLTGGAPYKEVLLRALQPTFLARFLWAVVNSLFSRNEEIQTSGSPFGSHQNDEVEDEQTMGNDTIRSHDLGRIYQDGEVIFHKGDMGDCMFVVQEGQVEVVEEMEGQEVRLRVCRAGEVVGEMAIFERQARSATVRALGTARVLTVDEKTFLRYVHQDPSLAYQLLKIMSNRVRKLSREVTQLTVNQGIVKENPPPRGPDPSE